MNVYGQLVRAQLEVKTSDHVGTIPGMVWFHNTESRIKFSNGTSVVSVLANDGKAVFGTNGTANTNFRFHRPAAATLEIVPGGDTTAEGTGATSVGYISAAQQNFTTGTRPSFGNTGRTIWNTTTGRLEVDTGTSWEPVSTPSTGVSIEALEQLAEMRHIGAPVPSFDTAILEAFEREAPTLEGFLLDNYVSGTKLYLSWNPKFLESSNKNSDFVTYTGVSGTSTANLDTETTTKKIGASAQSWDKTSGTVNSFIQRDVTSAAAISVASNRTVEFFLNLPSATDVTKISIRMSADAADPANFAQYDAATDFETGAPFISGWNFIVIDLDGAKTTVGTGWDVNTQLLRTFAVGIVTGSTTTTKTNIIFDSLTFCTDTGSNIPTYKQVAPGMAFTIVDNTHREAFIISSGTPNVLVATITGALANTYSGGTSSVAMRSVLGWIGDNRTKFQTTSPFLGATLNSAASDLTQDLRVSKVFKSSVSAATFDTTLGFHTELQFEVIDTPLSTTISAVDLTNFTAQLLNTHTLHLFTFYEVGGRRNYSYQADITLTANSSFSSNVITFTASSGDVTAVDTAIAAGHGAILVKKGQFNTYLSLVTATANESFGSAMSINNINVSDVGMAYPLSNAVDSHYFKLTAARNTATFAAQNFKQKAPGVALVTVGAGAASFARPFQNGEFGAGAFSDSDYFRVGALFSDSLNLNPDSTVAGSISASFWIYAAGTPGAAEVILDRRNNAGNAGWHVIYFTDRTIRLAYDGSTVATSAALTLGTWNHVVLVMQDNTLGYLYVNTVRTSVSSTAITNQTQNTLWIGRSVTGTGSALADAYLNQIVFWSGSLGNAILTDSHVQALYNRGAGVLLGPNGLVDYRYHSTGISGQKISLWVEDVRTTNAVESFVMRVGSLKTA